ncbi:uncharacterized protein PADG_01817 [Paracoccidioides brasiliensis Pb18]|uniref:C2H2-type domain-containing protein n=1 Tax=Paracoccidioides brasiliensis (strain Pb18) TaxID=502780 RepID=C1G4F1_PARBD|nr:uncharacterized protein PADG_01817 [Paracoccidioides brasiliensis Pb18]EEH45667.2 hypothetical protein PADG_01817 [Paracoccidioides brasiliensis Pb18]
MDHSCSSPYIVGEETRLGAVDEGLTWSLPKTEANTTQCDLHISNHALQNACSNASRPLSTLKNLNTNSCKLMQPPFQRPVEAYAPRVSHHTPSVSLDISINAYPPLSSSKPENSHRPELLPHRSASRALRKLRDHLRPSYPENPPENSNNLLPLTRCPSNTTKENLKRGLIPSWSASIKQVLLHLPRRKKEESNYKDSRHIPDSDTNISSRKSSLKPSHPGRQTRDQSPSLRSTIVTRETRRYTSNPQRSILSNAGFSYAKPRLPLKVSTTPLTTLERFQCTFCLFQCEDKTGWLTHEQVFHLEDFESFNQPYEHSIARWDDAGSLGSGSSKGKKSYRFLHKQKPGLSDSPPPSEQRERSHEPNVYSRSRRERQQVSMFWNCGFCSQILCSWEDRQTHLARHFSAGQTMRMWDPIKSPFPWRKGSAEPVNGRPHWDLSSLLALQRPTLQDCINQIGTSHQQQTTEHTCKSCRVVHPSLQHFDLWHRIRDIYTCPRISGFTNLAVFFGEDDEDESGEMTIDWCKACDDMLERPDHVDRWETRMYHLWDVHGFGDCIGWDRCLSKSQFILHLASAHAVNIECMRKLVRWCRKKAYAPALMAMEDE